MVAVFLAPSLGWAETARPNPTRPYPIVDTGQSRCYGPQGVMECPTRRGEPFFGQDAQIKGAAPHYRATGLTWTQDDSGDDAFRSRRSTSHTRDGRLDWREALNPIFHITAITDDEGKRDWPYFWTGNSSGWQGSRQLWGLYCLWSGPRPYAARWIADGPGMGIGMGRPPPPPRMGECGGTLTLMDVHGADAQRSSPKSGDEAMLPKGMGPQGDVLRIYNFARCVRG